METKASVHYCEKRKENVRLGGLGERSSYAVCVAEVNKKCFFDYLKGERRTRGNCHLLDLGESVSLESIPLESIRTEIKEIVNQFKS